MAQTLSADELADLQAQLSKDFAWLLPRESGRRGPPLEVLLDWVADASGAPVLRDQGPIGRPGTARSIQAVTLYMAVDGAAVSSRPVAADELQIWSAAEHPD